MKTSNIQTTHGHAIIRGWVDPAGLAASSGTVTSPHENASGVAFAAGDVVVLASDNTVVLTTTAQDTRRIGVALDDIPWGSTGPIAWQGPVPRVNVTSIVTEGTFAETAGIVRVATSYPVRRVGSFGVFTSSGSAPSAYLFGTVDSNAATVSEGGMVPYYIPVDETFTVPLYRQALFYEPIEVDGALVVLGLLQGVD